MTYDLAQLRAFLAVVEAGSVGLAADLIHMSQPALSRAVKRLEAAVGEPLFERHATGMRLTSFGRALVPHAHVLDREEQIAREEINAMRGMAAGTLKIGTTSSTSALMLPKILASFWARWPGIHVEATEGVRDELMRALTNYEVDLILAPDAPDSDDIVAVKDCRWTEDVSVVVGASHPLLRKDDGLGLEDLRNERWCLTPMGTDPRQRFVQLFCVHGVAPPPAIVSTTSIQMLKSLVVHSNLVSWLTTPMYEVEMLAGRIHPLHVPGLSETRTFTAFRRRHGILSRPACSLIDELRVYLSAAMPSDPGTSVA